MLEEKSRKYDELRIEYEFIKKEFESFKEESQKENELIRFELNFEKKKLVEY